MDNKVPIIDEKDLNKLIEQALQGDGVLVTPKEISQMLINLPGVSINSKPRSDGRWQGYVIKDGEKRIVYGRSKEELAMKLKAYYQYGLPQKAIQKKKSSTPKLSEWLQKWLSCIKPRM